MGEDCSCRCPEGKVEVCSLFMSSSGPTVQQSQSANITVSKRLLVAAIHFAICLILKNSPPSELLKFSKHDTIKVVLFPAFYCSLLQQQCKCYSDKHRLCIVSPETLQCLQFSH